MLFTTKRLHRFEAQRNASTGLRFKAPASWKWLRARKSELHKFAHTLSEFDAPLLPSVRRMWKLLWREKFSPDEVFMLALLDPGKRDADLNNYFSKERLLHLQLKLNPAGARKLTADKLSFHRHCVENGISTPGVICVISGQTSRSQIEIPCLASTADWESFFSRQSIDSIFIKPVSGAHGKGVLSLDISSDRYIDSNGRSLDVNEIFDHFSRFEYESWMIQKRIVGHKALRELSDTRYLQTVRVVTYIDGRGSVKVIGARLRLIGGRAEADNFNFGLSGNLIASIDASSGCIKNAVTMRENLLGLICVSHHPSTGRPIIGFQVPCWGSVLALVETAARKFLPLRTVGWDLAITDDDVLLVEGNETWDSGFYDLDFTNEYDLLKNLSQLDIDIESTIHSYSPKI